ncbi:hypothetical protein QBC47DRAFT_410694 [Echria macrotheca]|uniref:Uncharacterized protein n=1 Tax=Echria macrotheca TaxID=438768 RepID=A0AAJ0BKL4_9PEZI|nr:hypothetical protein QBC47DRAFT_410694 [Echria macrotheca]
MSSEYSWRPLCPDWVINTTGNVNVARDRKWFTDYRPIKSFLDPSGGLKASKGLGVIGIGTVNLPVKRSPKLSGPDAHGKLRLENVLHVPTSACNIVSRLPKGHVLHLGVMSNGAAGSIMDEDGKQVAYLISHPTTELWHIRISGPPVGPTVGNSTLEWGEIVECSAHWSFSEREKWAPSQNATESKSHDATGRKYKTWTDEEMAYIQKIFGSEFDFLRQFHLKVYHQKDRDEGRRLIRNMMARDEKGNEEGDANKEAGPAADGPLTDEERAYMKKKWGGEYNFLRIHGWSIYKEEDREEGRNLIRTYIKNDKGDKSSSESDTALHPSSSNKTDVKRQRGDADITGDVRQSKRAKTTG